MHFTRLYLLVAGFLSGPGLVSASRVRHSRRDVKCYFEMPAARGDTCESLASSWGVSVDLFININPGVICPNLEAGKSYCVIGEWTPDTTSTLTSSKPQSTTTSTSTTTQSSAAQPTTIRSSKSQPSTTTSTSTTTQSSTAQPTTIRSSKSQPSATTPSATPSIYPTVPGIAKNCDRFYMIKSGDQCDTIASRNGITVAQLRNWNTEINAACSNLWLNYYVCIHVPGAVLPSTTTSAPRPSNTPTMPGIAPKCDRFYKIKSGDQCDNISAKNNITVAQLRSWNTQINSSCNNLWLDYYACVGVPGAATPMPGIVANCSRYYQVVSGNGCDSIATKNGITVANFRRWNTFINAACTNLWANALVCTNAP